MKGNERLVVLISVVVVVVLILVVIVNAHTRLYSIGPECECVRIKVQKLQMA